MIKKFINNPKYKSIVIKVISSVIFTVLFFSILVIAEGQWPNKVLNNLWYYINTYLRMGL